MTFPAVLSVIQIGPVSIHWYGLLVVVGILLGYIVIRRLITNYRLPITNLDSLFFHLIIWGLIGARLYHVLNEPVYYWNNPLEVFKIWNGGLAIHGAILAGMLVVLYFSRRIVIPDYNRESKNKQPKQTDSSSQTPIWDPETKNKQKKNLKSFGFFFSFLDSCLRRNDIKNFFIISDLLVVGLVLGQFIGRWGNYFNQELFGKPTEGLLRVAIDLAHRPAGFEGVAYFHPTFFYESVLNLILFIILYIVYRYYVIPNLIWDPETKNKQKQTVIASRVERGVAILSDAQNEIASSPRQLSSQTVVPRDDNQKVTRYALHVTGYVTAFYLLGYGLIRFFVDFYRIDPRPFLGGLYLSQWVSLGMIVIGILIWYTVYKKQLTVNS